jgi:hypothetical protein
MFSWPTRLRWFFHPTVGACLTAKMGGTVLLPVHMCLAIFEAPYYELLHAGLVGSPQVRCLAPGIPGQGKNAWAKHDVISGSMASELLANILQFLPPQWSPFTSLLQCFAMHEDGMLYIAKTMSICGASHL